MGGETDFFMANPPGEVVTFPDASDLPGLPKDPFSIKSETGDGTVRPAVVVALLNRNMRRQLGRRLKKQARSQGLPDPIIAPLRPRLTERETTARVADMLLSEWDKYHRMFPVSTLVEFLDARTAETMEKAFLEGKPIDRDATRRAIGELWKRAEAKRNQEKSNAR